MNLDVSPWIGILSATWLFFFILGRWQFNRIKHITTNLILEEGRRASLMQQPPTVDELYIQILPGWKIMLKKSAWFILHKSELFPVLAWPKIVQKRLNFTPAWMGAYLLLNGIELPADAELKGEIKQIVALVPKRTKKKTEG